MTIISFVVIDIDREINGHHGFLVMHEGAISISQRWPVV